MTLAAPSTEARSAGAIDASARDVHTGSAVFGGRAIAAMPEGVDVHAGETMAERCGGDAGGEAWAGGTAAENCAGDAGGDVRAGETTAETCGGDAGGEVWAGGAAAETCAGDAGADVRAGDREPVVEVLGVRHHGPGSARSMLARLDALRPRVVLVEWPADGQRLLQWIGHDDLEPPVAMLATLRQGGAATQHAFWPLAGFSPEWQAVLWARRNGAEVVAIDAPTDWMLSREATLFDDPATADHAADRAAERPTDRPADGSWAASDDQAASEGPTSGHAPPAPVDPLAELAAAVGEPDPERWWEDLVEHRGGDGAAFVAIADAMAAVRGDAVRPFDDVREAHMRRAIRSQLAAGEGGAISVVCGAWHVPALTADRLAATVRSDTATLRRARLGSVTRRSKAELTWVPWSDRRLQRQSGYGAGVAHPGWYRHVFAHPGREGVARFLVDVAGALRTAGLAVSSDHVIAATRLSETLAALRRRPRPALAELLDCADAVLDDGAGAGGVPRLGGILDDLTVGNRVGAVPAEAPQLPLLADVLATQRRLRLKPVEGEQLLELDLRTPNGLARSHLLHRLAVLGVGWGTVTEGRGTRGTFRETWTLNWDPAMAVRIVEHGAAGLTLADAASVVLSERAAGAGDVVAAAAYVNIALLADLPAAAGTAVTMLGRLSAAASDIGELIDALVPLARAARYGDVRASDRQQLAGVIDELVVRVLAGLPDAARNLDDESSAVMVERLAGLQGALATLDHPERRRLLPRVLVQIADDRSVNGLLQGRASRLLHDDSVWTAAETSARLGRALTAGTAPAVSARFIEGFLAGSGTLLMHDHELLAVVDEWIATLDHEAFAGTVALLRRTFGSFEPAERRQLGALLARGIEPVAVASGELDPDRVAAGLATVRLLLGVPPAVTSTIAVRHANGRHAGDPSGMTLTADERSDGQRRIQGVAGPRDAGAGSGDGGVGG